MLMMPVWGYIQEPPVYASNIQTEMCLHLGRHNKFSRGTHDYIVLMGSNYQILNFYTTLS